MSCPKQQLSCPGAPQSSQTIGQHEEEGVTVNAITAAEYSLRSNVSKKPYSQENVRANKIAWKTACTKQLALMMGAAAAESLFCSSATKRHHSQNIQRLVKHDKGWSSMLRAAQTYQGLVKQDVVRV